MRRYIEDFREKEEGLKIFGVVSIVMGRVVDGAWVVGFRERFFFWI